MNRQLGLWPVSGEHAARLLRYHQSARYPRATSEARAHDVSDFWQRWVATVHAFAAGNAIGLLLSEPVAQPVRFVEARDVPAGEKGGLGASIARSLGALGRHVPRRWWSRAVYGMIRALERADHARNQAVSVRGLGRSMGGGGAAVTAERLLEIPQLAWHLAIRPDKACYYAFIINTIAPHLRGREAGRVLEIGPGSMHLAVTLHQLFGLRFVFVDLPETFNWGYTTLATYAPKATIALPNEVDALGAEVWSKDFVLLCPEQVDLLPSEDLDGAINCSSFQEMTYPIVATYLQLIHRTLRPGGFFYCLNETSFAFADGTSMDFERYAWPDEFDDVFHEACPFFDDIEWRPRRHRLLVKRAADGRRP